MHQQKRTADENHERAGLRLPYTPTYCLSMYVRVLPGTSVRMHRSKPALCRHPSTVCVLNSVCNRSGSCMPRPVRVTTRLNRSQSTAVSCSRWRPFCDSRNCRTTSSGQRDAAEPRHQPMHTTPAVAVGHGQTHDGCRSYHFSVQRPRPQRTPHVASASAQRPTSCGPAAPAKVHECNRRSCCTTVRTRRT